MPHTATNTHKITTHKTTTKIPTGNQQQIQSKQLKTSNKTHETN